MAHETPNHIVTANVATTRSAGPVASGQDSASVAALRAVMADFGLSQYQFGLRINTDERTVHYWLKGTHAISLRALERDPEIARRFAWFWMSELS